MRSGLIFLTLIAGCAEELTSPSPSLDAIEPALVCNDQFVSTLIAHGKQLTPMPIDTVTENPKLVLPLLQLEKASELDGTPGSADRIDLLEVTRWIDSNTMSFDVVPENEVPIGGYTLHATNNDRQSATADLAMAVVPPPTATALDPNLVCLAQGPVTVTLTGDTFLVVDGIPATIHFGGEILTPDSSEDCFDVVGPMDVESCSTLPITLPAELLAEGLYDVVLTNPEPAECSSTEALTLQVFAPPVVRDIVPNLECEDGTQNTYSIVGEGFLDVAGVLPTVTIGTYTAEADSLAGCSADPSGGADQICTEIIVAVDAGLLLPGVHPVTVLNPAPVGCASTEDVNLEIIAGPVIDSVEEPATCTGAGDVDVVLRGAGFLFVTGPTTAQPMVTVDGVTIDPATVLPGEPGVDSAVSCPLLTNPSGTGMDGMVCDTMTITIPASITSVIGIHDIEVRIPDEANCDAATVATATFEVTAPPEITSVQPSIVCDNGQSFAIFGTNFAQDAEVQLDGIVIPAADVFVNGAGTQIDVTVAAGFGAGIYDVTVYNVAGCEDTLAAAIEIVDMPIVFFVDPPVTYNQINIQATIYVSGVNGFVREVWLEEASTGALTYLADFTWNPLEPGQIQAVMPAGLPEGDYHVYISDELYCDPSLDNAIFEEADLTIGIDSVEPPFGWTNGFTAVEITATNPTDFQNVPRVYLNPVDAGIIDTSDTGGAGVGVTSIATELSGVDFKDGDTLNAVVPAALPVDEYDVLVINPDGTIGLLPAGFQVVPNDPPVIDSVSPGTLPRNPDEPITIYGNGFLNPRVEAECTNPDTGAFDVLPVTVVSSTLIQIDALFPADSLSGGGGVCIIIVYSDYVDLGTPYTTWGKYAAVSVTNPSQNLYAWRVGPDMNVARQALSATAGRSTRIARNLYAIGGDDGTNTLASIERAPVGQFGDLSPWEMLQVRNDLPEARSYTGLAQLGRFVYLVGGFNGTTAVNTVWRAQILDPLEAPVISSSLGLELGDGVDGMPVGTYVYRVAALFDASYDDIPNGESLPSDPFVVRIPDVTELIDLTLSWSAVPDAVGYRIYRSSTGSGFEQHVVDVMASTAYTDRFLDVPDPTLTPLPQGSLGTWSALANLNEAREGGCSTIAWDPATPGTAYLYAAGGRDATGTVLDSIEYLGIQEIDEHDNEAAASWSYSILNLPGPRWQCQAFNATNDLSPSVPVGETYIYFGSGLDQGGSADNDVDGLQVGAGGDFSFVDTVSTMKGNAGYVFATASDFLYALGGKNGLPSNQGFSAEICDASKPGCAGGPPELQNWNSLGGGGLIQSRYLVGSAQESSVIFAVGGDDGGGPTTSVEFTNY